MLHSSSSMSSYSISFSRTNRSSSIYLTPLPFSSTNARNLVEWAYTRYQVKPPYISTKCTMHALPWLIYCPLPKKTTITTTAKDTHRSPSVCSWTHFIKPKGVLGNDMNLNHDVRPLPANAALKQALIISADSCSRLLFWRSRWQLRA